MTRPLREAESSGVRCRWNPEQDCAEYWNHTANAWWTASHVQCIEHAAVFTELFEQPYVQPVRDDVSLMIEDALSFTNGWHIPTADYQQKCDEITAKIRPLVLASATVEELVKALEAKGAKQRQMFDGFGKGDLLTRDGFAAEKRVRVIILPPEPTR